MTHGSLILKQLHGEQTSERPVWLMRQAGRYLPEYRELRAEKGGFLELVYDSKAAAEITMQPIWRFGFDAAILFADILMIPHAMGQHLKFTAGEGPRLSPRLIESDLAALEAVPERLDPIYETVRLVRDQLDADKALLGFAGSPWTVATYMIHGEGSRDQTETRLHAYQKQGAFAELIAAITQQTIEYLSGQIKAGVDAVQLFDSWAGNLSPVQFERWVIAPNAAIVSALKERHPDTPIIGFPKGAGGKLPNYARETGVDALGLDETVDPVWAHKVLPDTMPVQGNLDPLALLTGGEALDSAITNCLEALSGRPHIFNLGHGIIKETPISHVEHLMARLRP